MRGGSFLKTNSLRTAYSVSVVAAFVVAMALTFVVVYIVTSSLRQDFAVRFGSTYADNVRIRITLRMQRDLNACFQLADSEVVTRWLGDETNPLYRDLAFQTFDTFSRYLENNPGVYAVIESSRNYYLTNVFISKIDRDDPSDTWYFKSLTVPGRFMIDIDYDDVQKKTIFWVNVPVRKQGRLFGIVGTGIDFTAFLDKILYIQQENSFVVLFDEMGMIKGYMDRSLIDKDTVFGLIDQAEERKRLHQEMRSLERTNESGQIRDFPLTKQGTDYMASLAWIPDLGWYALVMIDENQLVQFSQFVPIFVVMMISLVLLLFYIIRMTDRIVLDPLKKLVGIMEQVRTGGGHVHAAGTGEYEVARVAEEFDHMISELERQQARIIEQERLAQEFEVVRKMQSAILPKIPYLQDYSLTAVMQPAQEIGGDYYDFYHNRGDRLWYGIGDVSGHGIIPGVIMLMTQSAVNTILLMHPDISPRDLSIFVNRALYENIHARLRGNFYMTCYFLTSTRDGQFSFAGSHAEILIYRAGSGECERIKPNGTWLGVFPDISRETVEQEFVLASGDVLVLYTDGITEAMNEDREEFGMDRLVEVIRRYGREEVETLRERILLDVRAHMAEQQDDMTLFIIRRK